MAPKHAASFKPLDNETKRRRKMLTIQQKVKLLDMIKDGKKIVEVARHYGLNESTVRSIRKDEKNIRAAAAVSFNKEAKRVATSRNKFIMITESALAIWISDSRKNNVTLNSLVIREKARQLYQRFTADDPQPGPSCATFKDFTASKGWFEKFQKRYQLKSVVLHREAASADQSAAEDYVNSFQNILEEGNYLPEQVFNMDETGLFWKRMPSRTFIFKDEAKVHGFKAYKDRVTVVMCGNAEGFLLKPALIYKAKNPRALKNKNKNLLPVHWMHNANGRITKQLTSDWFHKCFIPQVKLYLVEKGLEFNVLLLMDNAEGHAQELTYDGVRIEFLPPNTTSLIQPIDQGVIRTFKALYTRNALQHLVEAMDLEENFLLKDCWRQYTIATCLKNIHVVLKDIKMETVNASWKKLWPEIVHDNTGFTPEDISNSAVVKAVRLARMLGGEGFADMTRNDVDKLLETHLDPLTDEDLVEMAKSASEEEDEQPEAAEDQEEEAGLTLERLSQVTRAIKEVQDMIDEWDPQMMRALRFQNALDGAMEPYKDLLTLMKKQHQQLPVSMLFSCAPRHPLPRPSPSAQVVPLEEQ
ncbi:tigger transposable element-derived protein 1-like [Dunckerocampus dactyliophorus]|uniref:tigger transposable element-derived protein 1-like n=1 Tax=Dunckerocampus dactyliophorus TaxID=161453 RepID=UPI00240733BB|nr:tigger transposable element-derived protein 1-like [Dunckerocampus dactyliophorus]XP_054648768.1 tigger transposable element-derived protein 1-like [Dunckerocampus dactyliophorus]XP_054648775.1 tigger transposable element-derived protein 1-like [Dunckerocampus dactyliophorus]XP_054648780.1 tigger transposable element-derived protein 1-like [Dunckerocampus dactyliophorus]XP_054648790.1 tigger transposable element-derived protein 1-like [Dunckerocampus dactyliophorus]XP_054648801.1 tigger tra